jgi:pimeloyl-ACP methyl ester carboxylesterase
MTFSVLKVVLLLSLVATWQQAKEMSAYQPPGKLIDIGGYRLHLNCSGTGGPTVILISGAGDFSFDWSLVQQEVSRFARVCSYDPAGLAWSDPGPVPRTMRQESYELHTLLKAARLKGPFVLVGHSLGGLTARVFEEQYPTEVAGLALIDSTHEDTTLLYQGKLVRMRERDNGVPIPPPQTLRTGPPQLPTKEDIEQFNSDLKASGPPKIRAPYDKLPADAQAMRVWFLTQPPRAAAGPDLLPEELQAIFLARAKATHQLADKPLVVVLPKAQFGNPPRGVSADEWKRINEEKRQQKIELTNLSRNSRLMVAQKSGHHVQLDEPQVVTDSIRLVVDAVRRHRKLPV